MLCPTALFGVVYDSLFGADARCVFCVGLQALPEPRRTQGDPRVYHYLFNTLCV